MEDAAGIVFFFSVAAHILNALRQRTFEESRERPADWFYPHGALQDLHKLMWLFAGFCLLSIGQISDPRVRPND